MWFCIVRTKNKNLYILFPQNIHVSPFMFLCPFLYVHPHYMHHPKLSEIPTNLPSGSIPGVHLTLIWSRRQKFYTGFTWDYSDATHALPTFSLYLDQLLITKPARDPQSSYRKQVLHSHDDALPLVPDFFSALLPTIYLQHHLFCPYGQCFQDSSPFQWPILDQWQHQHKNTDLSLMTMNFPGCFSALHMTNASSLRMGFVNFISKVTL